MLTQDRTLANATMLKIFCLLLNIPICWGLVNLSLWIGSRILVAWDHPDLILWPSVFLVSLLCSYFILRLFKIYSRRMILASFVGILIFYFMVAVFTYFEFPLVPTDMVTK